MHAIDPYELTQNPFDLINRKWALITAEADGHLNAMTASWGGMGVLWGKPVAYVFIRPQRFTRELIDRSVGFSLCFLPESKRDALNYCGRESGRNGDKLAACGLTIAHADGLPLVEQSDLVLCCRKLYRQKLEPGCFVDTTCADKWYPEKDFHYMYVAEIVEARQA